MLSWGEMDALLRRHFFLVKLLALACLATLALSAAARFASPHIGGHPTGSHLLAGEGQSWARASRVSSKATSPASFASKDSKASSAATILEFSPFFPHCGPSSSRPPKGGTSLSGWARSTLPLTLLGTMQAEDPNESMATLLNTETAALSAYRVNETLHEGVSLERVERGRVVLRNGERVEYIDIVGHLPQAPLDDGVVQVTQDERGREAEKARLPISCSDENSCTISRSFVDKLLANPRSLAYDAKVVPSVRNGETQGFKFYAIKPDSLPKHLGVNNGDVLTSVDGIELSGLDAAMELATKLRSAKHVSLVIDRRGSAIRKEIEIR